MNQLISYKILTKPYNLILVVDLHLHHDLPMDIFLYVWIDLNNLSADRENGWVFPGNNADIQFLFKNGETRKLENDRESGEKHFATGFWRDNFNKLSEYRLETLKMLQTLDLEAIRYNTSRRDYDFELTVKQQRDLKTIFKCVYNW